MTRTSKQPCASDSGHSLQLARPVIAFAFSENQKEHLLEYGLAEEDIFLAGHGAESLDAALAMFRSIRGTLVMAFDGRTLGESKSSVLTAMQKIEYLGVAVYDVCSKSAQSLTDVLAHALKAVAGWARIRGRRTARRLGARGGLAKAAAMRAMRGATVSDEIVWRLLEHVSLRIAAYVLGPPFSPATLSRHYKA